MKLARMPILRPLMIKSETLWQFQSFLEDFFVKISLDGKPWHPANFFQIFQTFKPLKVGNLIPINFNAHFPFPFHNHFFK